MKTARRNVVLAVAGLAALLSLTGNAQAQNKCLAGKIKCVSKKKSCLLGVEAKARSKGVAPDAEKLQACKDQYDGGVHPAKGCFAKLEAKNDGPCVTTGDSGAFETKVDAFVDDVVTELDPVAGNDLDKCAAGKIGCVAKKDTCLLGVHIIAIQKGQPVDTAKLAKCNAKFSGACNGGANINQACAQDTDCPGGKCTEGCFTKLEAKKVPCQTNGDAAVLEAKIDAFDADVVCGLDPSQGTCPDVNPTSTPQGAVTPTPAPSPTGAAPTCVSTPSTYEFTVSGTAVDQDHGSSGLMHDAKFPAGRLTLAVSACGTPPACGQCTLSGPIPNAGGAPFAFRRCRGDSAGANGSWIVCTSDSDCLGTGNGCTSFFGPPQPIGSGGLAFCVTNELRGAVSGTLDPVTGAASVDLVWRRLTYFGDQNDPCPRCNGGVCASGPRVGQACTVQGTDSAFGDDVSLDCPPPFEFALVTPTYPAPPIPLHLATGSQSRVLSAASPSCTASGFTSDKCFCDTCDDSAGTPCASNADCAIVGAVTCGGKRCLDGPNNGTPCTAASQCLSGTCAVGGFVPSKPNGCDDGVCSSNPNDTDSVDEGICVAGPFDLYCAIQSYRACATNADCSAPGDTCSNLVQRECFVDNGILGGTVRVAGVASTTTPTFGGLYCAPLTPSTFADVAGVPGLGRLTLPGTAVVQ
jgi:hypothetical protein